MPELLRGELLSQLEALESVNARIDALERRIGSWHRQEADCERLAAIPGVGRLTATAIVATVAADASSFRSGREFAAFLGLVPRQSGTGGRVKMLGISKRGDPYLRTLLIHGARAVLLTQSRADRAMDPWLKAVLARRPKNVAIVALANKMARRLARAGSTFREATRQPQPGAPSSAFLVGRRRGLRDRQNGQMASHSRRGASKDVRRRPRKAVDLLG